MNTLEFIEKALKGETRRDWVASVMQRRDLDGGVTVYSYGYHYPLVKIIDGRAFVNDRGYSVTTSKHIGHAFRAAANIVGYDNVFHAPTTTGLHKNAIIEDVAGELTRLQAEMDAKKRKDTAVYRSLEYRAEQLNKTLNAAREL